MTDDLARRARRILLANWRRGFTVPAQGLYPHQWSWDSAFIALGLRHLSAVRAQRELESLFGAQWPDGRVPQIVFNPAVPANAYFPGPDFWGPGARLASTGLVTSGLVQPPLHALAAWEVHRADPVTSRRRGFLRRLYPKLQRWHDYLFDRRDLAGDGLVCVIHPWESGLDNSPAWDEPLGRVAPVAPATFVRRDLGHAGAGERPTDLDYGRYVRLAADYRDAGFVDTLGGSAFAVEDPLTNALLAVGETALAAMAGELGTDPAPHRERAASLTNSLVARLYDPAEGTFFARDAHTKSLLRQRTVGGLVPLVVPGLPVVEELLKTARGEHFRLGELSPVPSYDLTSADFEPARYWRGPAWFNTGWLIWHGLRTHGHDQLAGRLGEGMLDALRLAGFREYVDPLTGAGHGSDDFSWTAAVAIDLLEVPAADGRTA
ncbi:hypothetical protein AB0878_36015 [Amycolatopsis sp. NPDC047767]|uniref:MGH1-like glycoside hydrolase domain-containing protein n=1 Tax=Amycolatopsis sp. NPDC047767 TaxID=3156765 RepID=UPI0034567CC9